MNFIIKKVVLWAKNERFAPKEIVFEKEKINVIVGDSQTGKSSIIPIIDYCLCSSKCTIPVGPIRKTTKWFGVLAEIDGKEILLARMEPGNHQSTNQMYVEEGEKITIPQIISEPNRTSIQVTNRLNTLCELPSLDFASDDSDVKPYENKPSIKDMLAFCFQSQHIIANPYTLFYQADTVDHKLKLRTVFPLALGIIQANTLELQKRLAQLNEEHRDKNNVMKIKRKIRDAWAAEVKGNYLKAMELGLLKDVPFPEDSWQLEDFVVHLQHVPQIASTMKFPILSEGVTTRVINYTTKIQQKENQILNSLEEKSYRLSLLKSFKSSSSDYESAMLTQRARLEPVNNGWLSGKLKKLNNNCPVCGSESTSAKNNIEVLIGTALSVQEKVTQIASSKEILDKEVAEIEKEVIELEKQLNNVRAQLESLGREHDSIERQRKSIEDLFRYAGKIEQNLKNLDETRIDNALFESIQQIEVEIAKIIKKLNQVSNRSSKESIMKRISTSINYYKLILKVEEAENPTEIDDKQLTLKITSKDNRVDYLWEIGSGSNWMGYHISTLLALHEHFLSLKNRNHVPTFIVFDQPSQAYFPDSSSHYVKKENLGEGDLDAEELEGSKSNIKNVNSDDAERVKAIFEAFSNFYVRTKFKCQVIVLEHASPDFWGEVEHTHFVDGKRWSKNDALIPQEWIDDLGSN